MFITIFLFTLLLACVSWIFYFLNKKQNHWKSKGVPHEKPHWLFGNLKGFQVTRSLAEICQDYYDKFKDCGKPFVGFYFLFKPIVICLDPALIKNVLIKDFNNFSDHGHFHNEKDDPLSGQLFNLDGSKWRNLRNKLSPAFTSGKMKLMFPMIMEKGRKFIGTIDEKLQTDGELLEIKDLLSRFTTDVIGTCVFGIECNSLDNPNTEFRVMSQKSLIPSRHNGLVLAFMQSFVSLAQKLHMKMNDDDVIDFYLRIVRETVEYRELNGTRRNDFMDMLIDLKNKKLLKSEHGDELTNLTMEEITAQAFVFFNAGFETSSTTMSFALYELAQHQNVQDKARKEITEVLERHGQQFDYECMKEMQYLEQIISETLRLYTVLPFLNRIALNSYTVPDDSNYVIEKGMQVFIPSGAIHRDERYYPQPNEFNPDNFTAEKVAERDSILFLPFGEGPRNCIGMRFGMMQTVVGLALLLKNYRFLVCERTQKPLEYNKKSILISTKSGIYLRVEKIEY